VRDEIEKDLKRTNTSVRMTTKQGWGELQRVLLAMAFCEPDIGYCQGMNFIAGVLIDTMGGREEEAFLIFMYFVRDREMKPLFLPVSFCFQTNFNILGRA
jgi:hypothetical protein